MDAQEKKNDEWNLEDILKEFSAPAQEAAAEEDVVIWNGRESKPAAEPAAPRDTVRLDEITRVVKAREEVTRDTVAFTPVGQDREQEEQAPVSQQPQKPETEPFSDDWEPEYEQPIGDYVPPQPIIFRPRSRLQELKRKLVAGPEKRYYELMELGSAKLQMAILGSFLVFLLTAGVMLMYSFEVIGTERAKFVAFVQFLGLLISATLGSYQLMAGFADMVKLRFSLNSLLLFSLIACLADGLLCLQSVRLAGSAAFCFSMMMSLCGEHQRRTTEMGQMDTLRKAVRLDGVAACPDYMDGRQGFLRKEGQVEDFMDSYAQPSTPEKVQSVYALAAFVCAVGIGIASGVMHGVTAGVQAVSATLLVAVPSSFFITLTRPFAILERRLHKHGVVLCGWKGVQTLSKWGVFPLEDSDLFPAGTAKLNGLKFYGKRSPDDIISYAAALVEAGGGGLAPLFSAMRDNRAGFHYEAVGLRSYNGGIGAEVDGEAVLAGSLSFMQDMGVDMPEGTRVNQAVYVAVDGALCAVFAVSYGKSKNVANALTTLCAYRKLTPVVIARDFMLTESFLHAKFGVNTRHMAFPDRKTKMELAEKQPDGNTPALALTTHEGILGAAYAVTGSKALHASCRMGMAVHLFGGILGIIMMLVLTVVGAEYLLTPSNLLLYQLVWTAPGILITEWTRSV